MTECIAIVEDDSDIRENYADLFRRNGYQVVVYDGRASAADGFRRDLPDLAILDIGLGAEAEGGFELCRDLRARSATLPIIFLTARDSDLDVVSGLRLGADDYLTKDISLPHLAARVSALFRRVHALTREPQAGEVLRRGDLTLDADRLTVSWRGRPVPLTLTEFWMLHALAVRPGHVKSRAQLMEAASIFVDLATISTHIKRIRRKFRTVDADFAAIEAVHGVGYRLRDTG